MSKAILLNDEQIDTVAGAAICIPFPRPIFPRPILPRPIFPILRRL